MYSAEQLQRRISKVVSNPKVLLREANRAYYTRRYGPGYNHQGIDVFEENWDTLVILDACRYDMFAKQNSISGNLKKKTSRASHTSEFLRGNFNNRTLLDTVYSTASPQLEQRRAEIDVDLHAINNVWNTDRWNADQGTVMPESMTEAGIEAHDEFPNKRHIVHYMQPHYPFINSDIDDAMRSFRKDVSMGLDIWGELFRGNMRIKQNEIWQPYRENLDLVLGSVETLLNEITGRTVITSDHGNMIGERASPIPIIEWGHPPRLYTDVLVTIPWLVVEDERREIISEKKTQKRESVSRSTLSERLEDLGYLS
jgi:hypothetical protein